MWLTLWSNFVLKIPAYVTKTPQTPAATEFEATNSVCFQYNPMQQGTSNCGTDLISNESQMATQNAGSSSLPAPEVFLDSASIPVISRISILLSNHVSTHLFLARPSHKWLIDLLQQLLQISGWDSEFPNLFNTGFHY